MTVLIGARWDGPQQNKLFKAAKEANLLQYIELSTPLSNGEEPFALDLPIYAHSTENPIASAYGLNPKVMEMVKESADKYQSPWIGEHLCLLAPAETGSVGYVINPICDDEFKKVSVENVKRLQDYYKRPIAIELGPAYNLVGSYADEVKFINEVACEGECQILLDISHLVVSNRNLKREDAFGLNEVTADKVIEIHITGMRESFSGGVWHDDHGSVPSEELYQLLEKHLPRYKNLKAITLEVDERSDDEAFLGALERLNRLAGNYAS